MELSIVLMAWEPSEGAEPLLAIARAAELHLSGGEKGEEVEPMVSVFAQAVAIHEQQFGPVPGALREELIRYIDRTHGSARDWLHALLSVQVTAGQLRALANLHLRASSDWSHALSPAISAARKALRQASEAGDAELFWTACLILCQPGLGIRFVERSKMKPDADPVAAAKYLAAHLGADVQQARDSLMVNRALSDTSLDPAGASLFEMSLADFQGIIHPNETVVLFSSDDSYDVFKCEVRRDALSPVSLVNAVDWSHIRFLEWRNEYPARYGYDLQLIFGHLRQPAPGDAAHTISGLCPLRQVTGSPITVIPDGRLYQFIRARIVKGGSGCCCQHAAVEFSNVTEPDRNKEKQRWLICRVASSLAPG